MTEHAVLTSIDEGIYTITLNRPDKRNAVDGPTADACAGHSSSLRKTMP